MKTTRRGFLGAVAAAAAASRLDVFDPPVQELAQPTLPPEPLHTQRPPVGGQEGFLTLPDKYVGKAQVVVQVMDPATEQWDQLYAGPGVNLVLVPPRYFREGYQLRARTRIGSGGSHPDMRGAKVTV